MEYLFGMTVIVGVAVLFYLTTEAIKQEACYRNARFCSAKPKASTAKVTITIGTYVGEERNISTQSIELEPGAFIARQIESGVTVHEIVITNNK